MVKRIGNWYEVSEEIKNEIRWFNVLVQKNDDVTCDPSSILVFDDNFNKVQDFEIWNRIEERMERIVWKNDIEVGV
jgi:hypothetical protein